jgi:uncharacterized protein (TIRG00374 family)
VPGNEATKAIGHGHSGAHCVIAARIVDSAALAMTRPLRFVTQLVPAVLSLALLAFVLRTADLRRAFGLVNAFGWLLPLLLLPNVLAVLTELTGWWLSLARLGRRPRFLPLLGVRLAADALQYGLPSGAVVAESMQPYLLKHRCALPLETAIVASVARRFLILLAHGTFLLVGTLLAWSALSRASRIAIARPGLPWLLVASSLGLLAAAAVTAAATVQGRLGDRVHRALDRFGGRRLGAWLERNAARFRNTDERLSAFFSRPAGFVAPVAMFLVGWLLRSLETYVYLRVVGVSVTPVLAMVIEAALILVRAAAVPVPAGLGVQDVGYVLCLRALQVPDAATLGTAFVVLKRGKDLVFILLGFLLLVTGRGQAPLRAPTSAASDSRTA